MSSAGSSLPFARGVMKAYEDAFKPPASAAKAAARGLEMREKQPPSKRGGTAVGVSRARDLKARKALSKDTIKRMVSFFARHRDPESSSSKTRGEGPSEAKQADLLWGGSAGKRWANSVKRKLEAQGKYSDEEQATPAPPEDRIEGSDKNPRGSAKKAGGIDLGSRTEAALRGKARNHNMRMREPWQKTTKGALEAVWRRGAGAYSTSHRPGVSRAAWAMARVNAFLYLLRTGKPKDPKYKSDNDLLPRDHPRKTGRGEGGRYVMATESHYADESKGRWITIGARSKKGGDSDGPSGGARVFIKDGKVAKGPGAVKGKSLSQIDEGKPKRGMAPAAKAKIGGAKEPKGRKSKVEFAKTIRDFDAMSRKDRYGKIGQLDDELSKMKKGGASQEEIATAKDRLEQLKTKNRELMEAEEKDLMVDQRGIVSSGPSWLIGGRIEAPGDDATAKVREARKEGVLDAGGGYQISNDTGTIVKVPKGMKALRGAKLVGREGRKIHERVQDNAQRVESAKDKRRDADQAKRREAMAARKKKIEGIRKSIGLDKREPKGEEVKKGRLVEVKKGRLLSEAERFGRAMRQRKAKRRKARAGGGKWVAERQAKRGKRGILSRLGFADEAVIYADDENGRWVTIGAQEVDGKKKGGTPVFISQGGKITKGPKALTGRNVSNLKEPPKEDASEDDGAEDSKKTSATNDVSKMAEMLENTGLADSHGLIMRSWEKGDKKRIYIKRQLSKRVQDVGFIDVDERDNVTYESQRINSVIRTLASWAREIIDGEFSDDLTHYAESEGRWITIGAVEEEDAATGKTSRKGGTPVFIRNGKITKGPKSLKGKSLGKLDKDVQPKKAKANRQKAFEEAFKKIKAESEARAGKPAEKAPEPKAEAPKAEMKVRPGGKTVKGKYGPAIIKDVGGFDVKVEVNNPDGSRRSKEERDAEALRRGIEKKKRFEAKMKREMGTRTPKAKAPTPESEKPKAEAPKAEAPKKKLTGAELDKFIRERSDVGKKHSERRFRRALPSDEERAKAKPKKAKKPKKERRPFEDAEDMRAVNKRLDMIAQGVKRKRAREAARRAGRKTFAAEVLRMYQEAFA